MTTSRRKPGRAAALAACAAVACVTDQGLGGAGIETSAPLVSAPRHTATPKMRYGSGISPTFTVSDARKERLRGAMPEIESYLAQHYTDPGCPGAAFGVVLGNDLIWWKGFGVRDLAKKDPVDRDTVFRIGSLTKTFTGVAMMLLRDDGSVNFDEPVSTYVPEVGGVIYPTTDSPPITPWHLMTHSSGLPRLPTFDYTKGDHDITEKELLDSLDGVALESVPGVRTNYSNLGFAIAGTIVDRASGMSFRDFVKSRILDPIGMKSTVWTQRDVPAGKLATGYELRNGRRVATPHWRLGASEAMGGLYSSLADMAKYTGFQLSAWPPRDGPETGLMKRSILRESQLTAGEGWARGQGVGVAWAVKQDPLVGHLVAHAGAAGNYAAAVRLLPERQLGVIGLCSTGDAPERLESIEQEVLGMLVRRDPEPSKPISGPMESVMKRIHDLMVNPTAAGVNATFSPMFLEELPASQMLQFFNQAKKESGACPSHRGLQSNTLYDATILLQCEKQSWKVTLKSGSKAPYLIEQMYFNPGGRD